MRPPARHRTAAAMVVSALLLAGCSSAVTPAASGALGTLAPGDPLERVSLPVLASGDAGAIDTGALGGPAVINFWATWCSFCVDEMPDFEAVHREYLGRVRFIGVDREDKADRALTFAAEIGVTYELVQDLDGSFFRSAKGRGMPTTLFVDDAGIIRYRHAGPLEQDELRDLIEQYLDIGAA